MPVQGNHRCWEIRGEYENGDTQRGKAPKSVYKLAKISGCALKKNAQGRLQAVE